MQERCSKTNLSFAQVLARVQTRASFKNLVCMYQITSSSDALAQSLTSKCNLQTTSKRRKIKWL